MTTNIKTEDLIAFSTRNEFYTNIYIGRHIATIRCNRLPKTAVKALKQCGLIPHKLIDLDFNIGLAIVGDNYAFVDKEYLDDDQWRGIVVTKEQLCDVFCIDDIDMYVDHLDSEHTMRLATYESEDFSSAEHLNSTVTKVFNNFNIIHAMLSGHTPEMNTEVLVDVKDTILDKSIAEGHGRLCWGRIVGHSNDEVIVQIDNKQFYCAAGNSVNHLFATELYVKDKCPTTYYEVGDVSNHKSRTMNAFLSLCKR
jgi:hypothetical protein